MSDPRFLLIFGPPGAGKGTQAAALSEKLGVPHVSTGDMFRAHQSVGTDLGKRVKALLASGALVPDEITNEMVRERLAEDDCAGGALLDGFPRNVAQAEFLDGLLAGKGTELERVLVLEVPDVELTKRLAGRAAKQNRPDDADPGVIASRIATYRSESEPCIAYYREKGTPVNEVEGVGTPDAVRERLFAAL